MMKLQIGDKVRILKSDDDGSWGIENHLWAEWDGQRVMGCDNGGGTRYRVTIGQLKSGSKFSREYNIKHPDGPFGTNSNVDYIIEQLVAEGTL